MLYCPDCGESGYLDHFEGFRANETGTAWRSVFLDADGNAEDSGDVEWDSFERDDDYITCCYCDNENVVEKSDLTEEESRNTREEYERELTRLSALRIAEREKKRKELEKEKHLLATGWDK